MNWRHLAYTAAWFGGTTALLGGLSVWQARRAGRRAPDGRTLPVSCAEVPILAFKAANFDLATFQLRPVNWGFPPYGTDDDAVCAASGAPWPPPPHRPPELACSCGFYALASGHTNSLLPDAALVLEVELSGKVVVAEHGYRAQHQRVLKVWLGLCNECRVRRAVAIVGVKHPESDSDWESFAAGTRCDRCLAVAQMLPFGDRLIVVTPADAAARLGVPVAPGVPPAA